MRRRLRIEIERQDERRPRPPAELARCLVERVGGVTEHPGHPTQRHCRHQGSPRHRPPCLQEKPTGPRRMGNRPPPPAHRTPRKARHQPLNRGLTPRVRGVLSKSRRRCTCISRLMIPPSNEWRPCRRFFSPFSFASPREIVSQARRGGRHLKKAPRSNEGRGAFCTVRQLRARQKWLPPSLRKRARHPGCCHPCECSTRGRPARR